MSRIARGGPARALAIALALLLVDQATKAVVRGSIAPGERVDLVLGIELVNVTNRGIAFGLLSGGGAIVLVVTLLALGLLVAYFLAHPRRRGLALATGLLLGGALGNLADRVREGEVTDFIDLGRWPAFNIADVAITAGIALLVLTELRHAPDDGEGGRTETDTSPQERDER